jgi:hypothetical protein
METVETIYPNHSAASEAGTIGAGKWIPEFLPLSAVNIRERHNLDTNEVWLFFQFNFLNDIANLAKSCKRVDSRDIRYPRNPGIWWPEILTKSGKDTPGSAIVYEHYQCKDGGFMAIDSKKTEVFYWHLG